MGLNKDITRRRRLPAGDGDTKGDEGTFAYNMRSGKCVEDDSGTACDGKDPVPPHAKRKRPVSVSVSGSACWLYSHSTDLSNHEFTMHLNYLPILHLFDDKP